ncbi:MAG: disulfide bond formation protein B [Acidimicrobiales bacterium]
MSLSAAERFFSLLALVAAVLAVLIVVLRLVPAGRPWLGHLAPAKRWLAFAIAATAMVGSLYFSESQHFEPCKLCWYQRIAMYSTAIVLLQAAIRRDRSVRWYVVSLTGLGACVSIYHYLLEWYPQLETSVCSLTVPCTAIWYREFGFVTLSFSALCGFAAILALMIFVPDDDPSLALTDSLEDTDV